MSISDVKMDSAKSKNKATKKRKSSEAKSPDAKKSKTEVKKDKPKKTLEKESNSQKTKERTVKKDKTTALRKKVEDKKEATKGKTLQDKKEIRKKQKELKAERQKKAKTEDVYQLGVEAKKLWEKARDEKVDPEHKVDVIQKLFESIKGSVDKIVHAHDTVRVLECLVSLGTANIRTELFKEAQPNLMAMIKSKYGHYFVAKLLKYGTKEQRDAIMKTFDSKIAELMKHKIANNVVETYYNEYANAVQRNRMLQEFCGPEFRAFKENEIRTAKDLIAKHPEKEKDIVRHLGDNVNTLITKGCYNHSLVHTVIHNYFQVCTPKDKTDVIVNLRDACVHILHSQDGSRVVRECFWFGTAKDRKAIIKTFKGFVTKICTEEHGHLIMMSLFDTVDDTKLVAKAILSEINENMAEIAANEHGRKVLLYLVAPRDTTYFHPDVINMLKRGDGNEHSKKDTNIRQAELRTEISPAIVKHMLETMKDLFYDNPATVFLGGMINHVVKGESLLTYLAEECSKPFAKGDDEPNLIENPAMHKMLKKIIGQDKVRAEKGEKTFSQIALETLDEDGLESWIMVNRGCFVLVTMWETEVQEVQDLLKNKLKNYKKTLQQQSTKGAEILRSKLK